MPRPRLSDNVFSELATGIISGRFGVGALLPPEQQLCAQFDVSRTVVREATAHLARCGLVEIRQGLGSAVRPPRDWNELDPELIDVRLRQGLIGDLIADMQSVRILIEVEAIGLAAERRTEADLDRLRTLLDKLRGDWTSAADYIDNEIAFHNAIADASGNKLLGQLLSRFNQIRRIASIVSVSEHPLRLAHSLKSHQALFDAILARDREAARVAMTHDIDGVLPEIDLAADDRVIGQLESRATARSVAPASNFGNQTSDELDDACDPAFLPF